MARPPTPDHSFDPDDDPVAFGLPPRGQPRVAKKAKTAAGGQHGGQDHQTMCAVWDWTFPQDGMEPDAFIELLKPVFKKWVFQVERGDSGYMHFQGRGSLHKRKRFGELKKLLKSGGMEKMHISETVTENTKGAPFYMTKLDTRVAGPFSDRDEVSYVPRQYRGLMDSLYPWQRKVAESAKVFDARIINVIYDRDGNNGKSTVASLMELFEKGIDLPPVNDAEKLIQSMCDICMAREERKPSPVFIDMPRAMEKKKLHSMFVAIEQIKKGKLYDVRHHYKQWWIDSPAMWVFSNTEPELSFLSRDRWRIWTIDKNTQDLVPHQSPPASVQQHYGFRPIETVEDAAERTDRELMTVADRALAARAAADKAMAEKRAAAERAAAEAAEKARTATLEQFGFGTS
jgi:hypothetical protein